MSRHRIIPAAYLVLEQNNKFLMLRRLNTGYHDGDYSLISGHINEHESLRQCIIREAKEEADIVVKPEHLKLVHVVSMIGKGGEDRANFFWSCSEWQGEPQNKEPEKCDDLSWFDKENLPANMAPEVKVAFENIFKGEFYSELNI